MSIKNGIDLSQDDIDTIKEALEFIYFSKIEFAGKVRKENEKKASLLIEKRAEKYNALCSRFENEL